MERLQLLEVSSVENPRFAAIQKCSKYDGLINFEINDTSAMTCHELHVISDMLTMTCCQ